MADKSSPYSHPPDDRLERYSLSLDTKSSIEPEIIRWTMIRSGFNGLSERASSERELHVPETFAYPLDAHRFLLYSPLAGIAALVNQDTINILHLIQQQYPNPWLATMVPDAYEAVLDFIRRSGLLRPKREVVYIPRMYDERVDLSLTSDCNLRCVYCFASAGERPRFMTWEMAKAGIDLVIHKAIQKGKPGVEVVFEANGEQFLAWPMMVKCTKYAREQASQHGLRCSIRSISNGYLNEKMALWAAQNLDHLAISLDGPPDIQDTQRPTKNNTGSTERVVQTIQHLDRAGGSYSVRATITPSTVHRMAEIVEFVADHFPHAELLHVEPLFPSRRSQETGWEPPTAEDFANGFLEAQKRADEHALRLIYNGYNLGFLTGYHCDAWGVKIGLTPEGLVTSCPEVSTLDDERSDYFIYGRYNVETGQFDYDTQKLRRIMARNLSHLRPCDHCMLRWHCAGECLAKVMICGDVNDPTASFRCEINRRLFPLHLLRLLNTGSYSER